VTASEPSSVEPVLDRLHAITADLLGYLEHRATEIAAPRIAEAERAAAATVRAANAELQRRQDLVYELRRHLDASVRQVDRLKAKSAVSAAHGEEHRGGRR
jgi:hypothetical protein